MCRGTPAIYGLPAPPCNEPSRALVASRLIGACTEEAQQYPLQHAACRSWHMGHASWWQCRLSGHVLSMLACILNRMEMSSRSPSTAELLIARMMARGTVAPAPAVSSTAPPHTLEMRSV